MPQNKLTFPFLHFWLNAEADAATWVILPCSGVQTSITIIAACILTFVLIDSEYCQGRADSNNEDTFKIDLMKIVVRVELINKPVNLSSMLHFCNIQPTSPLRKMGCYCIQ